MRNGGSDIYRLYVDRSLFVYGYINSKTNRFSTYVIDCYTSQLQELLEHLENLDSQVCFDGLSLEYQIIDDIITSREVYLGTMPSAQLEMINRKAYAILSKEVPIITEKDFYIPQIDLSKLLGLNTSIRTTKMSDVARMFNHDYPENGDNICLNIGKQFKLQFSKDDILKYIEASVDSIKSLCLQSSENVKSRREISSDFKTRLTLNMSDIKAGEVLACRLYCKKIGIDLKSFPKPVLRLNNQSFDFITKKIIFSNSIFHDYENYIEGLKLNKDTQISYRTYIDGIAVAFGNGGIHGCCNPGIYDSNENETIVIQDITSFYASIICHFKLYPSHLTEQFIDVVQSILDKRFEAIDSGDESKSRMLKNMLVGIFGKFKEQQSNLFDITLQTKVIVAAQMIMCWWIDRLMNADGITILGVNTDGLILRMNNNNLKYISYVTNLVEDVLKTRVKTDYINKLYIKDINNYMYISKGKKIVKVGCFDNSFSIYKTRKSVLVADVISKYLLNNLKNTEAHREIYGSDVVKAAFKIIYSITEQQQSLF